MSQRSAARILCVATVFFCLFAGTSRALDETTLTLEFTVSNTASESRDVNVSVDLPKGLRVEDFISTDGLDLVFQQDRQAYSVKGKVALQAGETTLYRVQVKDIWMIGKTELNQYRAAAAGLPGVAQTRLLDLLTRIEQNQEQTRADIKAHIAAYQDNKTRLHEFDMALMTGNKPGGAPAAVHPWFYAAAAAVVAIAALFLAALLRGGFHRSAAADEAAFRDRRKIDRIVEPPDVECRLLASQDGMPAAEEISVAPKDLSEGGICLQLPDAYRSQSVIELRMKLPGAAEPLMFRGSVVWQKKVVGADDKSSFMTGIQLGEATYEDYEKLKAYVNERSR